MPSRLKRAVAAVSAALLSACATVGAPAPAPERAPTAVSASFAKTWDAVIDFFAERNIPISTIDRSSGFIATNALHVGPVDGQRWADCGTTLLGAPVSADGATYNVVVRGDSAAARVRVTVRWAATNALFECQTRGLWESDAEEFIAAAAEGREPRTTTFGTAARTPAASGSGGPLRELIGHTMRIRAPGVRSYELPDANSRVVFTFPGTYSVVVADVADRWVRIEWANNKAWVPAGDLIRP